MQYVKCLKSAILQNMLENNADQKIKFNHLEIIHVCLQIQRSAILEVYQTSSIADKIVAYKQHWAFPD